MLTLLRDFLFLGVFVLPAPTAKEGLAQVVPTWANFHALADAINAGLPGSITVQDEGITLGTATTVNTVGAGVTGTLLAGVFTITVPGGGGGGTVTSVGLAAPAAEFTVSGSPVVAAGTLTFTKNNQSANTFWAGPVSGAAAQPTFRTIQYIDITSAFDWGKAIATATMRLGT